MTQLSRALRKGRTKTKKFNLCGQRFGRLTVVSKVDRPNRKNGIWLCECECGNRTEVSTGHLRSGHTKSCGRCQTFVDTGAYIRCVLPSGRAFIFDRADLDLVKKYSWSVDQHGYVHSWSQPLGYFKLHRLLMKVEAGEVIDHRNGDPSDNRRSNLRVATYSQNNQNKAIRSSNRVGYKGVGRHPSGKYYARICVSGKAKHLGYYDSPRDAAIAYDDAAIEYFGEYARLNFSPIPETRAT